MGRTSVAVVTVFLLALFVVGSELDVIQMVTFETPKGNFSFLASAGQIGGFFQQGATISGYDFEYGSRSNSNLDSISRIRRYFPFALPRRVIGNLVVPIWNIVTVLLALFYALVFLRPTARK